MSRFVLDCSVAMAWCFEDETTPLGDAALDALSAGEALVPAIWPLEVANVVLVGERRGRLAEADTTRFVALLGALPITVDVETPQRALKEVLTLARERGLSSYDAAYLELAMREGLALATLDAGLKRAAKRLGVSLITPK